MFDDEKLNSIFRHMQEELEKEADIKNPNRCRNHLVPSHERPSDKSNKGYGRKLPNTDNKDS